MKRSRAITTEQFVEVWMSSSNIAEVAAKVGRDQLWCQHKASAARVKGIDLPYFVSGRAGRPKLNVKSLNNRVAALLRKSSGQWQKR